MSSGGGHTYKVQLFFGDSKDYGKAVNEIHIKTSMDQVVTTIYIHMHMTRVEFDKIIHPYRDKVYLSVKESEISEYKFDKGKTIEILGGNLIILDEYIIDNPQEKNPKEENQPHLFVLVCCKKSQLQLMNNTMTNMYFYQKPMKKILQSVIANGKLISKVDTKIKDDIVEQFFIPPMKHHLAVKYTLEKLPILCNPSFIFYHLYEDALYVGDIKNQSKEPIKIKYITSIEKNNIKDYQKIISGVSNKFDFVTFGPVNFTTHVFDKIYKQGTIYNFLFFPFDTLYTTKQTIFNTKFYKNDEVTFGEMNYPKDILLKLQIAKNSIYKRYVLDECIYLKENAKEKKKTNKKYHETIVSNIFNNSSFTIKLQTSWKLNLRKILFPGRHVQFFTDKKRQMSQGKYYLDKIDISFKKRQPLTKELFYLSAFMTIKTGVQSPPPM